MDSAALSRRQRHHLQHRGAPPFRDAALLWIERAKAQDDGLIFTSRISRIECISKPLAANDHDLLASYDRFFQILRLGEIDAGLVEEALALRARFNLRSLDAIHLATSIREKADVFLTGDKRLARCTDVNVAVIA